MRISLLFVFVMACGGKAELAKIDGTATVGGKSVKIVGCSIEKLTDPPRAGVVVALESGLKYRHDPYAGPMMAKGGEWAKVECDKLGSKDTGGADWSKGELHISCKHADGQVVIDATYDCGAVDRPSNRKD